jgi:hypothetical protein
MPPLLDLIKKDDLSAIKALPIDILRQATDEFDLLPLPSWHYKTKSPSLHECFSKASQPVFEYIFPFFVQEWNQWDEDWEDGAFENRKWKALISNFRYIVINDVDFIKNNFNVIFKKLFRDGNKGFIEIFQCLQDVVDIKLCTKNIERFQLFHWTALEYDDDFCLKVLKIVIEIFGTNQVIDPNISFLIGSRCVKTLKYIHDTFIDSKYVKERLVSMEESDEIDCCEIMCPDDAMPYFVVLDSLCEKYSVPNYLFEHIHEEDYEDFFRCLVYLSYKDDRALLTDIRNYLKFYQRDSIRISNPITRYKYDEFIRACWKDRIDLLELYVDNLTIPELKEGLLKLVERELMDPEMETYLHSLFIKCDMEAQCPFKPKVIENVNLGIKECVICYQDGTASQVFPCGHLCACNQCAAHKDLAKCPICRAAGKPFRVYI